MLEALARIRRYSAGRDASAFRADDMAMDAVIRNLAVIGEAVRGVPAEIQERNPEVPWARLRGMRNVLIHEYFDVGFDVLWDTIQDDVPELEARMRTLLDRERP